MHRCRRTSVENWSWPPPFFSRKAVIPADIPQKNIYFFDTDAEKGVPNRKTRFPQKKNKRRCNVFCFKMEAFVHRNLRLEKFVKKVKKSSFIQKIDFRFHHLQLYLWEWRLLDNYVYFFFFFWLTLFVFLDVLSLSDIVPYRNLVA